MAAGSWAIVKADPSRAESRDARAEPGHGEAGINAQQFHVLFHQLAGPLRAYVIGVIGNATTADDIVQDAFLRFLRSPPATTDPEHLRALMFRIASSVMIDHWRKQRRERAADDRIQREPAVAAADVPLRVDMERTFQRLPPQQRQLLWLAYVEGADHQEIATALGVRPLSVRVLLFRARRKLAALIRRSGDR